MHVKHYMVPTVLALAVLSTGCRQPETLANTRMSQVLRKSGYSLYTPFRADDYPGTIFVYTKNHEGYATEFTLSPYQKTFNVNSGDLFPTDGAEVSLADSVQGTHTLSVDLAVEVLKPAIDISAAAADISSVDLIFGTPQKKFVMPLNTLAACRDKLKSETKTALTFYKQHEQLHHCYIVAEVFQVNTMDVSARLKTGADASAALQKIKGILDVSLSATNNADGSIHIHSSKPMLIGYKALAVDDTWIGDETSKPPLTGVFVSPEQVDLIKK